MTASTVSSSVCFADRRKWGIRIRDVFFAKTGAPVPAQGADLLFHLQTDAPGVDGAPFYTSIVDLDQDEKALFDGLHKSFRYEIRRAQDKDVLDCHIAPPSPAALDAFFAFYDAFAQARGLPGANRAKLHGLSSLGLLCLAEVRDAQGACVAAHLYLQTPQRVRLYHSAGQQGEQADRQLVGRANKLLHWKALQHFQAHGLREYDMGGLGMSDAMKALDQFKQQFGGRTVLEYNRIEAASLRGQVLLGLMRLRRRLARPAPTPRSEG